MYVDCKRFVAPNTFQLSFHGQGDYICVILFTLSHMEKGNSCVVSMMLLVGKA